MAGDIGMEVAIREYRNLHLIHYVTNTGKAGINIKSLLIQKNIAIYTGKRMLHMSQNQLVQIVIKVKRSDKQFFWR